MKRLQKTARYSKAVIHGNTVQLAGLVATDPTGAIAQQAQEIFQQIDDLLAEAGSNRSNLTAMTCWIADFADYAGFNAAYDAWIDPQNLPARATVRAELLDKRLRLEIMAQAVLLRE